MHIFLRWMPFQPTRSLTFNEWESLKKPFPSNERSSFEKVRKVPPSPYPAKYLTLIYPSPQVSHNSYHVRDSKTNFGKNI